MATEELVTRLRSQGVEVVSPPTLTVDADVDLTRIQGPHTTLHPQVTLRGADLAISPGCAIGGEGPATVSGCALGRGVALKAGYFADAVFLERASCALGAHVRGGTVLEEQASVAHTVGLKQTILLPFVTLGSLINFCDVLMAGGTSRRDHSEVGSSFIHFNFTPHGARGDKATPSLIGDVPRGVMLRSPRIFLGGQGGLVGPLAIDFGTVLAAGFTYRQDHGPDELVIGEPLAPTVLPFNPARYGRIRQRVHKNLRYIGNLVALWHWYREVRASCAADELEALVYAAGQRALAGDIADRIAQLGRVAGYMEASIAVLEPLGRHSKEVAAQRRFAEGWPALEQQLGRYERLDLEPVSRQQLLEGVGSTSGSYIDRIGALPDEAVTAGTRWLQAIVDAVVAMSPLE